VLYFEIIHIFRLGQSSNSVFRQSLSAKVTITSLQRPYQNDATRSIVIPIEKIAIYLKQISILVLPKLRKKNKWIKYSRNGS